MTLLGLPAWTYAAGLAGLGATLFALHLLRIRLRRQTVDSLLFFRQVGAVHKPRVLLGLPARWLSFALGLLLLFAAWSAFADPKADADGPSRVLLLDTTAATAAPTPDGERIGTALAARAAAIADEHGLGPRGRVLAFGAEPTTVWNAGEPLDRLEERVAALGDAGSTATLWPALADAARGLETGDEIVVLGGPDALPTEVDGIPVRRALTADAGLTAAVVTARLVDATARTLQVEANPGGGTATVRAVVDGTVIAEDRIDAAPGATAIAHLTPLPDSAAGTLLIEVVPENGDPASTPFPLPERKPLQVHVVDGVPDAVLIAIEADGRTARSALADADVAIAPSGTALPEDLAALIVDPGTGNAARAPRRTAACPLPLGLRDRTRNAAALEPGAGEVWVEDANRGAALVVRDGSRIRVAAWLLDDPTHRDVPALVLGAVHALGDAGPMEIGPLVAPAPGGGSTAPDLDPRAEVWPWPVILLLAALAALVADAWLHHRGRVA